MQLIRTYQIFRYLFDIAVFICRNQFRTNRSIHNIQQRHARSFVHIILGYPFHQILNQSLRHTSIHTIHGHMISIISSPAQCQFRKIARTNYHSPSLVGNIHQYLRTLACLSIFINYIMHIDIMVYIFEMLNTSFLDTDLTNGDS